MTMQLRYLLSGVAIGVAVSTVLVLGLLWIRPAARPDTPAGGEQASRVAQDAHAGHAMPASLPATTRADDLDGPAAGAPAGDQEIVVSPQRLQAIGVRFEPVSKRVLDRQVRTTGQVEIDERRLARVTLKVQGWIEELLVNATGERVRQGQPLLTLYSPDLLVTQEEHLLALESARAIGDSAVPEVARYGPRLSSKRRAGGCVCGISRTIRCGNWSGRAKRSAS